MHHDATPIRAYGNPLRTKASVAGLMAFIGVSALFIAAGLSQGSRLSQYERSRVLSEASTVRVAIESGLNERISLERGVVAFMAANPRVDESRYAAFAAQIVLNDDLVKNLAVLEGTTVRFVYPFETNKAAVGVDLGAVPGQAKSIRLAMASRAPVVSGLHELVQGGKGIISRMGIYPVGPNGPEYWGQASVVLDSELLLERAGVADHPSLVFLIASDPGSGEGDSILYGDPSILDRDPVVLDVVLPGATWSLAAMPRQGWKTFRNLAVVLTAIGIVIAAFIGVAIHGLLTTRSALKELAYHDQLTELPNRALFWDRLRVEAYRAERDGTSVCLCMVDLDGFKAVNDDLGHEAGDRLLAGVAARISAAIRKSDTVARLGGDEFAVIASVADRTGVEEVRERLRGCFLDPFDLGSVSRAAKASIGCALYPGDGPDVEAVLAEADRRMYRVKHGD